MDLLSRIFGHHVVALVWLRWPLALLCWLPHLLRAHRTSRDAHLDRTGLYQEEWLGAIGRNGADDHALVHGFIGWLLGCLVSGLVGQLTCLLGCSCCVHFSGAWRLRVHHQAISICS